ncbi:MAG: AAA family ATPase [Dehalococcoidia bacterium]
MNESEERIHDLEAEAVRVLKKIRARTRKPLFVEFSGTPKAGKSTIINSLRLFLARNDFNSFVLTERASTCPIRNKKHLFFNVWTACATLVQMLNAGQQDAPDDVVIMDRGLFDALVWMRWLEEKGELEPSQRETIERFLTLEPWSSLVDLVFVMKVSPSTALEREFGGLVTRKAGSIMNERTISEFNEALELTLAEHGSRFDPFLRVDTTGQNPRDTSYEVVSRTLTALDNL